MKTKTKGTSLVLGRCPSVSGGHLVFRGPIGIPVAGNKKAYPSLFNHMTPMEIRVFSDRKGYS